MLVYDEAISRLLLTQGANDQMKRLTFTSWFCLLFTIFIVTGENVTVRSQDPLQEKLFFLKRNLQKYLTHSVGPEQGPQVGTVNLEAVSFETCQIAWKMSTEMRPAPELPTHLKDVKVFNHVSVDLSSLDAIKTKIYVMQEMTRRNMPRSLILELKTRPGASGFKLQMVAIKDGRVTKMPAMTTNNHSFLFDVRDQRMAESISKAFADASNICRSRKPRAIAP
jgi:hypothetical protein